jgi:hypothetical protein
MSLQIGLNGKLFGQKCAAFCTTHRRFVNLSNIFWGFRRVSGSLSATGVVLGLLLDRATKVIKGRVKLESISVMAPLGTSPAWPVWASVQLGPCSWRRPHNRR